MRSLLSSYQKEFDAAFGSIDPDIMHTICARLFAAYAQGHTVFLAGNGGSAALADHFACDLEKSSLGREPRSAKQRLRCHSLVANSALLTAWANDEGYEHVFSEALATHAKKGDLLIVISASGNSPNIVACLERAQDLGILSIGLLGFEGGKAKALCDLALHVQSDDYGIVEGVHSALSHFVTRQLIERIESHKTSGTDSTLVAQERLAG